VMTGVDNDSDYGQHEKTTLCKGTSQARLLIMSKLSTRSKDVRFKERSVYICTISVSVELIVTLSPSLHTLHPSSLTYSAIAVHAHSFYHVLVYIVILGHA
jgi:hypothetical protein